MSTISASFDHIRLLRGYSNRQKILANSPAPYVVNFVAGHNTFTMISEFLVWSMSEIYMTISEKIFFGWPLSYPVFKGYHKDYMDICTKEELPYGIAPD